MIAKSSLFSSFNRVLVIGGEDVDARIDLMQMLDDEFRIAADSTPP